MTYLKGTFGLMFIKVYRLEIQSVMLLFSTQLSELLPLSLSLWFNSRPPPPFLVLISLRYTHIQCVRGVWGHGRGGEASDQ